MSSLGTMLASSLGCAGAPCRARHLHGLAPLPVRAKPSTAIQPRAAAPRAAADEASAARHANVRGNKEHAAPLILAVAFVSAAADALLPFAKVRQHAG